MMFCIFNEIDLSVYLIKNPASSTSGIQFCHPSGNGASCRDSGQRFEIRDSTDDKKKPLKIQFPEEVQGY